MITGLGEPTIDTHNFLMSELNNRFGIKQTKMKNPSTATNDYYQTPVNINDTPYTGAPGIEEGPERDYINITPEDLEMLDNSKQRKARLDELDALIAFLKAIRGDSNLVNRNQDTKSLKIIERLQEAILEQIELLYPSDKFGELTTPLYGPINYTITTHDVAPEIIVVPEGSTRESDIDKATGEVKFSNYMDAEWNARDGYKVARKSWDNTLNEEYITQEIGVGYIKHYNSTAVDYFKRVQHTYKPTQEDREATDWYIL